MMMIFTIYSSRYSRSILMQGKQNKSEIVGSCVEQWVGLSASNGEQALVPINVWLLAQGTRAAMECLWGDDGNLVSWCVSDLVPCLLASSEGGTFIAWMINFRISPRRITSLAPADSPPAISGGLSSGSGELLFHPGSPPAGGSHPEGWNSLVGVQKARWGVHRCVNEARTHHACVSHTGGAE